MISSDRAEEGLTLQAEVEVVETLEEEAEVTSAEEEVSEETSAAEVEVEETLVIEEATEAVEMEGPSLARGNFREDENE